MRRLLLLLVLLLGSLVVWAQQPPAPESIIIQPHPTPIAIQMELNQTGYAPGDKLRLAITLSQEAYVYIYNITPDQRVNLLFPNAYQPVNLLKAGQHKLPDKRYSFVVTPPTGFECIQVLALAAPLALDQLLPQGKLLAPFPTLSTQPQQFKQTIQKLIVGAVGASGWAAAWTCFEIAAKRAPFQPLERSARLKIISAPENADVYIDDRYAGETPLSLKIEPGRYRIRVVKENYQTWEQIVEVKRGSDIALEATLRPRATQPGPPSPPWPTPAPHPPQPKPFEELREAPNALLAFNGGLNREQIVSVGFDFSFRISESAKVGFGLSFLFTGESVPEYEEIGRPAEIGPTRVYREGPEIEFYLRLSLGLLRGWGLEFTGGFSMQQEAHIAQPLLPSGLALAHQLDVIVKPNGYQTEKAYLTGLIGLGLRSGNISVTLGMHNRRGWVVGVGVLF